MEMSLLQGGLDPGRAANNNNNNYNNNNNNNHNNHNNNNHTGYDAESTNEDEDEADADFAAGGDVTSGLLQVQGHPPPPYPGQRDDSSTPSTRQGELPESGAESTHSTQPLIPSSRKPETAHTHQNCSSPGNPGGCLDSTRLPGPVGLTKVSSAPVSMGDRDSDKLEDSPLNWPLKRTGQEGVQTPSPSDGPGSGSYSSVGGPMGRREALTSQRHARDTPGPRPSDVTDLEEAADLKVALATSGNASRGFDDNIRIRIKKPANTSLQVKVYNFLERPTGWKCFIYHFTV